MADTKKPVDSDKGKKVWTTLITNEAYLPGLLTLAYSLQKSQTKYPLVALYTDSLPKHCLKALQARSIPLQHISYIRPENGPTYENDPRFLDCWTKLTPFSMTEYSRIVQLDSDMLVRRNMDELMDLPLDPPELAAKGNGQDYKRVFAAGHACVCNPLHKPHYPPSWTPQNCAFTKQHANPVEAQTDGGSCSLSPLAYLNGGLQVVNPSAEIFAQIVQYMETHASEMEFADQSVLSELFKERWVALPYVYNALKTMRWDNCHAAIWRDECVKNVHYILAPKPWNEVDVKTGEWTGTEESHVWWVEMNKERREKEKERGIDDEY